MNKDTLSLVEPTINHLNQSVSICKDIARKLELKKIDEEAEQMELVYLFSWNKMFREEKGRIEDYIFKKIRGEETKILDNTIKRTTGKKIEASFSVKYGPEEETNSIYGTILIVMNDTKTSAKVHIFDGYNNMVHEDELVVKPAENYSNDLNLFEKNKRNRKRR